MKATNDQHSYVEISYNEFRPNCVESMGNMSKLSLILSVNYEC